MAQTASPADVTAVNAILKDVYVSDNIESQLYEDALLLSELEKTTEYHDAVGNQAVGFIKTGRNVGVSSRSISQTNGTKLGAAGHQKTKRWVLDYAATYVQVKILGPTIAKMSTARQAAVREVDFEVSGAIQDAKKDVQRQLYTGDGLIATCGTTTTSATVALEPITGHDAIVRGWLDVDMYIDIGTTSDADSVAAERQITAVTDSTTAPTIAISGATVSTTGSHYISRAANRSPADGTSYEMQGLRTLVKNSGSFGGLDPATTPSWASSNVAAGGTLSRSHLQQAYRNTRQYGGKPDFILTSLDVQEEYYNTLQSQVRFSSDSNLGSGKVDGPTFNGIPVSADPDAPRGTLYFLSRKHLFLATAGDFAWQNATTGGDVLAWVQDEDAFQARAAMYANLGTDHRRAHAYITGIT